MLYLDNAAMSVPKPPAVADAVAAAARAQLGNPGRGGHRAARDADQILGRGRELLHRLFGGAGPERFVYTLNATDSLNLAIKGIVRPGDHVVSGVLEHNSVLRPLHALEREGSITLTLVGADEEGYYRPEEIEAAIGPQTRLVAVVHASNALGTLQPIETIGAICRDRKVPFLVDAAQTAGAVPIDLDEAPIDLLAAPGHKGLLGPTGTGFLYVAPSVELRPWREGGTGSRSAEPLQPMDMPDRLEAGTANVHGLAGLIAGIEHILETTPEAIARHERDLTSRLLAGLKEAPGVRVVGGGEDRPRVGVVSFVADWLAAAELSALFDQQFEICVRGGLHCAPGAHRAVGSFPDGALRVSPGVFNTQADIRAFLDAVHSVSAEFAA